MAAHPLLEDARRSAAAYRVLPSERGWHVWRFWPWDHPQAGWWIVVADVHCSADGWLHVLSRMGLWDGEPPEPMTPARRRSRIEDEFY